MPALLVILLFFLTTPAWGEDVVIFTRPSDGGVSVMTPAPACLADLTALQGSVSHSGCPVLGLSAVEALQWIITKDVPSDALNVRVVDRAQLPLTRQWRNAWREADGVILPDVALVRAIRQKEVERDITQRLKSSLEEDENSQVHREYRDALRTLRDQLPQTLGALSSVKALESWTPTFPVAPVK